MFFTDESNRITQVLAPVLLWAAHNPDLKDLMSDQVRERIKRGYAQIRGDHHPADYNPVEKVPLLVFRVENQVHIEETTYDVMDGAVDMPAARKNGTGAAAAGNVQQRAARTASASRDHMRAMQLQLNNLHQTVVAHQQQNNVSKSIISYV